jgi:hypothetical protein
MQGLGSRMGRYAESPKGRHMGYAPGVEDALVPSVKNTRSVTNIQALHVTHPSMGSGLTGHGDTRPSACTGSCLSSLPLGRSSAGGGDYQQVNHD